MRARAKCTVYGPGEATAVSLYLIPVVFLRFQVPEAKGAACRQSLTLKTTPSAAARVHSLVAPLCLQRAADVAYLAAHLTSSRRHRAGTILDPPVTETQASAYRGAPLGIILVYCTP